MGKKLKWNLILMSVLYLALGVFLLMVPGVALNVVCYALGGVVLVCAVVQLVRYFLVERGIFQSQLTLISGLICLGLGAFKRFLKLHPETQSVLEAVTGCDLNGDGVIAPDVAPADAEATAVELDHVDESAEVERED
mgnify:CR=1 FL=1